MNKNPLCSLHVVPDGLAERNAIRQRLEAGILLEADPQILVVEGRLIVIRNVLFFPQPRLRAWLLARLFDLLARLGWVQTGMDVQSKSASPHVPPPKPKYEPSVN